MSHFPNHPPSLFLATAGATHGDRMPSGTPGLGGVTEVYYEWWNVDLLKTLYHQLGKEERAAVKQVKQEAVPWKDPATGERRSKPTAAEKLVQKKRERREYETMCPAWQTLTQTEQQPSDCVSPHV